jgi:cytochrome oxidase Cu insertion factor (SCO1/SenC/PrrC family)
MWTRAALILTVAFAVTVTADARQTAPRPVIDVQALGPQNGARIPEFTLVDQTGARRTLRSLMGPKGLMLVLFRSADW